MPASFKILPKFERDFLFLKFEVAENVPIFHVKLLRLSSTPGIVISGFAIGREEAGKGLPCNNVS